VVDEEMILGPVEFELNPYALDFPTCPKGPEGAQSQPLASAPSSSSSSSKKKPRGGGRFGGAQRLALMRHAWADEPRLLAVLEASLQKGASTAKQDGNSTVETVGAYEPCSDGKCSECTE